MKKIIIGMMMLIILASTIEALGMGIIVNMNYGEVRKGQSYTRMVSFYPFDSYCTECPEYITTKITTNDEWLNFETPVEAPINQYTHHPITLTIPRHATKGYYKTMICAIGIGSSSGIGINVGACTYVTYTVQKEKKVKDEKK